MELVGPLNEIHVPDTGKFLPGDPRDVRRNKERAVPPAG